MTIETTANRISYTGSGTTGPFSFPYYFLADGDLTVIKTTIADGTESTLTLTTDYTVSGAGEAAGGSVTLVATLSSAYKLTIIRDPDILQPADYPANDRFPAATHEEALDRATMIMQRLKDYIDRSFRLSDGDVSGISLILSNLSAGELIAVNAAGTGIESIAAADVDLATVSTYILTLLDDANAAAARTTLGAAALGANTFTGLQTFAAGADIASATTVDLTAATGNLVRITGTTATTGVTINNGQVVLCYPTGAWPLTYHATNMPIKGGASYTCAAGDTVIFSKDGNGTLHVEVISANGMSLVGGSAGTFTLSGDISPSQITANQNDYNPTGLSTASTLRLSSDASRDVTGLQGGADGRILVLLNVGAQNIVLKDESGSSTAAYRFALSADITVAADQAVILQYDSTSSRWRALSSPSGSGITLGTPVASTSGTSIDFTGIPTGTKRITINLADVSTNSTSNYLVQIGDSGGVENTGYTSGAATDSGTRVTSTAGFIFNSATAAGTFYSGRVILEIINTATNTWVAGGVLTDTGSGLYVGSGGKKSLSAELDRVRITTVGGADTFDAGEINITYE